jgi:general secretion pathway protein B
MPGPRAMPPAVAGNAAPAEEPGPAEAPPQGAPPPLPAPAENAAAAVQAENSAPPAAPAAQQPAAPTEMTSAPPPAASDTAQHSLKQMPESYRANFPAFSVDVHAYNDDPQRRFVLIDGKRYREGDTLAQGPRLVGIVPEGLVLEWQGQQVLYPVGH